MFTASGLLVRFLKVFEKGNYQSVKWVRYLTKAQGSYQVRVSFSPFWPYLGSGTESFALWLLTVLSRLVRSPLVLSADPNVSTTFLLPCYSVLLTFPNQILDPCKNSSAPFLSSPPPTKATKKANEDS